jgi:hypothetical protein
VQYPSYVFAETLRDGTALTVRAAGANDGPKIRRAFLGRWLAGRAAGARGSCGVVGPQSIMELLSRKRRPAHHILLPHCPSKRSALDAV